MFTENSFIKDIMMLLALVVFAAVGSGIILGVVTAMIP